MSRFVIVLNDEETGPLLTGPMGGVLVYDNEPQAVAVATAHKPAFIKLLKTVGYVGSLDTKDVMVYGN